jgi:ethanolamine permease
MVSSLRASLTTWHIWALGVGLVISGQYFGWSYGWDKAGSLGFLTVCLFVTVMYIAFVFSFAELATAVPLAAGPFVYAQRAFGNGFAFIAGFATLVDFLFAPPAIAMAIGAYFNAQFPVLDPKTCALVVYLVFVFFNLVGVKIAATLEMVIAVLAVVELLVFVGVVAPSFSMSTLVAHGWAGQDVLTPAALPALVAAIPFAMWLFLGIEGAVMVVEETKTPGLMLPKGLVAAIFTLIFLSFLIMFVTGGILGWAQFATSNDPLPQAMKLAVGGNSIWFHILVMVGLVGLLASFHGLILASSRQVYGLARAGFLPQFFSAVNDRFKTPHIAIIASSLVGAFAIMGSGLTFDGQPLTASLIALSVLGAVIMYVTSMISLLVLRLKEPELYRPYLVPAYPWLPIIALVFSAICLAAVIYSNVKMTFMFFGIMAVIYFIFTIIEHHFGEQIQNSFIKDE